MAKMTTEELLGVFEEMSVLELSEFLKAFEEKFDVTAAAPMAMAVAAPAGGEAEVEEQDEFDVVLTAAGSQKIQVIKVVRGLSCGRSPERSSGSRRQGRCRSRKGAARRGRRHRRTQVAASPSARYRVPA